MSRPTIKVIFKTTGVEYLVNLDHYKKYMEDYTVVRDEEPETVEGDEKESVEGEKVFNITDDDLEFAKYMDDLKELRDFLRIKGITFQGTKSKANMIKLLEDAR